MLASAVTLLLAVWHVFRESSFFLLLGFGIAGLLHVLVPSALLARLLGQARLRTTVVAAMIGVPLPLCSCSVLPMAMSLRKKGASRGATVSFLVSTPETGVDSIALTWGLLGWVMAIFRPIAAFTTAVLAGIAVELFGQPWPEAPGRRERADVGEQQEGDAASVHADDHDHGHDHAGCEADHDLLAGDAAPRGPMAALRYGFVDLLDDMSHWLLLGLVLAGVVTAFLPPELVQGTLGGRVLPLFVMAFVGVPIYICASAATPIAASLMLKGLSPGAALVLLLAGPATSLASITVLTGYLGRRVVAIYVATVVTMSIAFGALLDALFLWRGVGPVVSLGADGVGWLPGWLKTVCATVFVLLLLLSVLRAPVPEQFVGIARRLSALTGIRLDRRQAVRLVAVLALVAWASSAILVVRPGETGAVLRFGRLVTAELGPGVHLHAPAPFASSRVFAVERSRIVELGFRSDPEAARQGRPQDLVAEAYYLTRDENLLDIRQVVEYRVKDVRAFAFEVADPDGMVRSVARSATVAVVRRRGIDAIYTTARVEMERELLELAQAELDGYGAGVELTRVALVSVHSPSDVHFQFREIASAREDGLTAVETARGYEEETIPLARGQAEALRREAESARMREVSRATGEAASFLALVEATRIAPEITRQRIYLEALEEMLSGGVRKIVRPSGPDRGDLDLWVLPEAAPAAPTSRPSARAPRGANDPVENPFLKALKQAEMRGGRQ